MNKVTYFKVGETYTNDQIRFSLDLENLGGIRPSLDSNRNVRHVAIMTATEDSGRLPTENPYHDRIEADVLIYTAQGREGDQALTGRNKRLVEQYMVPTPFFGFTNIGRQMYRFLGLLELVRHYQENQADKKGTLRKVWVFEFRIHSQPEIVPIEDAPSISASLLAESAGTIRWRARSARSHPSRISATMLRQLPLRKSRRFDHGCSSFRPTTSSISSNWCLSGVDSLRSP